MEGIDSAYPGVHSPPPPHCKRMQPWRYLCLHEMRPAACQSSTGLYLPLFLPSCLATDTDTTNYGPPLGSSTLHTAAPLKNTPFRILS